MVWGPLSWTLHKHGYRFGCLRLLWDTTSNSSHYIWGESGSEGCNADRSTTCFQNFAIPPYALAEPELPKTTLRASWKFYRDHHARLVSSNREDFVWIKRKKRYSRLPITRAFKGNRKKVRVIESRLYFSTRGNLRCLLVWAGTLWEQKQYFTGL